MREYILQLVADMLDDSKKLIDIADFQAKLVEAFDLKGILSSYRNDNIPAPKKNLTVNETKFKKDDSEKKDDPKAVSDMHKDFRKDKIPFKKNEDLRKS